MPGRLSDENKKAKKPTKKQVKLTNFLKQNKYKGKQN